jgi:ribonucleoside-diphosphate reductase alpha chain
MPDKKPHEFEEVHAAALEYFGGNELAADIWTKKYALRDNGGKYHELTPADMHRRLAREFARIEGKYPNPMSEQDIFALFKDFKHVVPQGSPMFGVGNPHQIVSQSNCFAIATVDSYGGICRADERIAQISKRRGGVGIDVSPIRPKGLPTHNAAHTTDGVIVFMRRFSNTSKEVAQHGRRGALMISCSVHHPEVLSFVRSKLELAAITGANISLRLTDEFMRAVKTGKDYELRWPVDAEKPSMRSRISAKEVWDEIVKHAFLKAEPGVLFWDSITRNSPADCYSDLGFATVTTNPCSELPLAEGSSCILVVLNLCSYVIDPFTREARFDFELFARHVGMAMRITDDLVDIEIESVERIIAKVEADPEPPDVKANELSLWRMVRDKCVSGRRTGLGITALGDAVAMLGHKYGDDASVGFVEQVYAALRDNAYRQSVVLAKERGKFPLFDAKREKGHPFLSRLPKDVLEDMARHGRRNIACLTTAPAGTVSNLTWCSDGNYGTTSGFEPVFLASYVRKKKMVAGDKGDADSVGSDGERYRHFEVRHPGLGLFCKVTGKGMDESPYAGAQAGEIDHSRRVRMQAAATAFVDHAISSTVNLPKDVAIETVAQIYMDAWELGCKGITVYREGSREGILVSKGSQNGNCDNCDDAADKFKALVKQGGRPGRVIMSSAPKRPEVLECDIVRTTVKGRGKDKSSQWVFLVGKLKGQPYEVFGGESEDLEVPRKFKTGWILKDGKHGDRTMYDLVLGALENDGETKRMVINNIAKVFSDYEHATFSRIVSLGLRHGVPIKFVCEQLTKDPEDDFQSYNRALARVLKSYIEEGENSGLECPNCHAAKMVYKGGCPSCLICGTSNCS